MRSPLKTPAGEARVYVTVIYTESVIRPDSPPSRSFSSPNETTPKQATMHRFSFFPVSGGGGVGGKRGHCGEKKVLSGGFPGSPSTPETTT